MHTQVLHIRIWPFITTFFALAVLFVCLTGTQMLVNLYVLLGVFILSLLLYAIKRVNKIILSAEGIIYKALFTTVVINWDEVITVRPNAHLFFDTILLNWTIHAKGGKSMLIPLGHYSRQSMQKIAEAVVKYCPYAAINPKIKRIANGDLPWYIF